MTSDGDDQVELSHTQWMSPGGDGWVGEQTKVNCAEKKKLLHANY